MRKSVRKEASVVMSINSKQTLSLFRTENMFNDWYAQNGFIELIIL